ncbi:MAG: aspartate carbamoyltransferase regulatory subunit [Ruminococcaceae bacterium]|nr:aspartate carbamoyltransferase regulatory subunit [Oscillospiraceae bacterium]
MIIGSIVNGVVIDHIPAGRGMELYHYLKLDRMECQVALIKNAHSRKHGKKDILKVNEVIELDFDMLGYIAPQITVDIIRDSVRIEKIHPELPERIAGVIRCRNPRCITSSEQELRHEFRLADRENGIYRCIYCDTKAEKQSVI